MHVLYVEDDTTLAHTVERMLLLEGYKCDLATTGEAAVALGKANDYDVILLDIGLPDMDGYEVIRQLRESDVDKPFLVQSGLVPRENDGEEFGFGVEDFLIKPFNRKELFKRLGQAMVRHRQLRQSERRRHSRLADWEIAKLIFADGTAADCTIFSRSTGGAALKVSKAAECWTKSFSLRMVDGRERSCTACWQFGDKVGVRFI